MKTSHLKIFSAAAGVALLAFSVLPVLAQTTGSGAQTSAAAARAAKSVQMTQERTAKLVSRADQEITRRITSLQKLASRINEMKKVTDAGKTVLTSEVQSQISALQSLRAKIAADADLTTLKADVKSITDSYRIYVLVLPQIHIIAAADRINTIVSTYVAISAKLQSRIAALPSGTDAAALSSTLADFNAKVADAAKEANAAATIVSSLKPDQGDQARMQANQAALKQGRDDLKTAGQDLKTARQDAHSILQGLHGLKMMKSASASSTAPSRENQ